MPKQTKWGKASEPTKIGTLQEPTAKKKTSWGEEKKTTTVSTQISAIRKKYGDIPLTATGHIDTRYFKKVPKKILKYNKELDQKITKAIGKEPTKPASLLGKLLTPFTFAHPYEALRDIAVEPEKYPDIMSKLGHYIETVKKPTVTPMVRGYKELIQKYYPEGWHQIFMNLAGVTPEGYEKHIEETHGKSYEEYIRELFGEEGLQQYREAEQKPIREKEEMVSMIPHPTKEGEFVDISGLQGLILDIFPFTEPTGAVLGGIGKLAKAPLLPLVSKAKITISEGMTDLFRKNLVAKTMLEQTQEVLQISPKLLTGDAELGVKLLGGESVFKNILKNVSTTDLVKKAIPDIIPENIDEVAKAVGKEVFDEASVIYLNTYKEGWQNIVVSQAKDTLPKGLSVIEYLTQKFSKIPYEAKVIDKLRKNLERGYTNTILKDFSSNMKGLGIEDNSLDAMNIAKYFDLSSELEGLKGTAKIVRKNIVRSELQELISTLTPAQKIGIDYWKKIGEWAEFIETSKAFGLELDYKHIKNYIFDKYVQTGKKTAYTLLNLSKKRVAPKLRGKPVFTLERQMTVAKAKELGIEIASPFERMKGRLSLHAKAINTRGYYDAIADMFGETTKKEGFRLIKIAPDTKKFVKPLVGKYFPEQLATFVENSSKVMEFTNFQQKLLKVMIPITRAYKTIWTASMGHQLRNFLGSHTQNAVYFGGAKTLNLTTQELVGELAWTTKNFDFLLNGRKVNSELFRQIFDMGGMGAGWYGGEIAQPTGIWKTFTPFRWLGQQVERDARMFAFYSSLNQGDDLIKSMLTVKLLHFDYVDGLSQSEKVWARLGIPMYSWYRFNTPLQLRFLIENPYRVSNIFKVWRGMGIGTPEETPEWFTDYMMGKIGDLDLSKNIQKYLRLDIPISDIGMLQPSYEALVEKDLTESQRFIKLVSPFVGLSHPFIKSLFELTSNFDTFRERPVYKKVVSPVPTFFIDALPEVVKNWFGAEEKKTKSGFRVYHIDGMKAKILENLVPVYQLNILSGYEKYEGYEEQKLGLDRLALMTGVKIYPVSLDYIQKNYKYKRKLTKIKSPVKKTKWGRGK